VFNLVFGVVFSGNAFNHWSSLSVLEQVTTATGAWLLAGSAATGGYQSLRLTPGGLAVPQGGMSLDGPGAGVFRLSDMAEVTLNGQTRLYSASLSGGHVDVALMGAGGGLSRAAPLHNVAGTEMAVSALTSVSLGGQSFLAAAAWDDTRLRVFAVSGDGQLTLASTQWDTPKSTLGGVSDLIDVTVGGRSYLVAAATAQDGLTSYLLGPGGQLTLADTIGVKDGLWVDGLDAVEALVVAGATYLVTASTASSTLATLRINDLGVLFITDQVNDTRETRFERITDTAAFSLGDRGFVLAGGMDGGLSLFELLPGGTLYHHRSYEMRQGWTMESISALHAAVLDGEVQVFVTSSTRPGLTQFTLPTGDLGLRRGGTAGAERIEGTAGDDLLLGYAGADTLEGAAGDDVLIAGTGADRLTGGAGADVFVFRADGQRDLITDFQPGLDRIDLSDWGRVYDIGALQLVARSYGTEILWQGESLRVETLTGTRLEPGQWAQDDFIF